MNPVQASNEMIGCLPMNHCAWRLNGLLVFALATISSPTLQSQSLPLVNGDRVSAHLKAMGEIGKDPAGGISRVAYSEADRQGREYVIGLMRAAGLTTSTDSAGNISGRLAGTDATLPALIMAPMLTRYRKAATTMESLGPSAQSRLHRL